MCVCVCVCVSVSVSMSAFLSVLPFLSIDIMELGRLSHSGAELASRTRPNVFDVELALAEMGESDVDSPCIVRYLC